MDMDVEGAGDEDAHAVPDRLSSASWPPPVFAASRRRISGSVRIQCQRSLTFNS